MHPAFSVIFLTTLIGVGQGLFQGLSQPDGIHAGCRTGLNPAEWFPAGCALPHILWGVADQQLPSLVAIRLKDGAGVKVQLPVRPNGLQGRHRGIHASCCSRR